jgi:hypothetical protein
MEEAAPGDQGDVVNLPPGDKSPDGPPDDPHCWMRRKMRRKRPRRMKNIRTPKSLKMRGPGGKF